MTFNVRYGTAPDGDDAWPIRRPLALRVMGDFAPAVLGLQEALRSQLDDIAKAMPSYGEVGVGRDDGVQAGEYAAVLYDRHRLTLLADGRFWLSDTPDVPGSMTWGNRFPRIVTWARFADRVTSETFTVFNTHWDHESPPSREASARLLRERITARPVPEDPVLVLGDLNCGEDDPAFKALIAPPPPQEPLDAYLGPRAPGTIHLVDTFRTLYPSAAQVGTFHAFRGDRGGPKIDFVLVAASAGKQWKVLDADIVHTSAAGRYPSDHFPVTATLTISDVIVSPVVPLTTRPAVE
jgi:endonuclease/exonuclease/phosphatase family metal-dependent hydrolase